MENEKNVQRDFEALGFVAAVVLARSLSVITISEITVKIMHELFKIEKIVFLIFMVVITPFFDLW